jgi:Fe-S-cluster containining protein
MLIRDMLPAVFRHLLPGIFDTSVPEETLATCDNCAMSRADVRPENTPEGYFRPDVKCCSFHPNLPNFLVGAILADDRPDMAEGQRRLRLRLQSRQGVGPIWLAAPRKYTLLFLASRKTSFGRSLILRCPYFHPETSNCSIWRHRDAVCTTFFCKHVGGNEGEASWRAIETILRLTERRLAEYAANVLGLGSANVPMNLETLTLEELEDRPPDSASHAALWGDWASREEVYYRACRDIVANLDQRAFAQAFMDEEMIRAIEKAQWSLERTLDRGANRAMSGLENEAADAEKVRECSKTR